MINSTRGLVWVGAQASGQTWVWACLEAGFGWERWNQGTEQYGEVRGHPVSRMPPGNEKKLLLPRGIPVRIPDGFSFPASGHEPQRRLSLGLQPVGLWSGATPSASWRSGPRARTAAKLADCSSRAVVALCSYGRPSLLCKSLVY